MCVCSLYSLQSPSTFFIGGEAGLHSFIYSMKMYSALWLGSPCIKCPDVEMHQPEPCPGPPWGERVEGGSGEVCISERVEQRCPGRFHLAGVI